MRKAPKKSIVRRDSHFFSSSVHLPQLCSCIQVYRGQILALFDKNQPETRFKANVMNLQRDEEFILIN